MKMKTSEKEKNIAYFESELPRLLKDVAYNHKFVVIHGQKIQGTYDTFDSALGFAVANFPPDEFAIQRVMGQGEQIDFLRAASV
jgi:hypothetical protein